MRVGSLFTGIGGLDLGLERAGMTITWQVENDPYCRKVLATHWPDVPCYGDIRDVDFTEVEPVDLVCGGFPCQPVSHNGHGAAQDDERWLWPPFARAIRDLRPFIALMENVAALTFRGLDEVVGDLAEIGYDAEWACIPASAVGAPHRRARMFVVAYPDRVGREAAHRLFLADPPQHVGEAQPWGPLSGRGARSGVRPLPDPGLFRVADGFPSELDAARLKALGNAVVPQVAECVGRRILEAAA
ncbi:MAG: DNA (cytosine-5-)-methyltransferase [Actinomycetota bacterium]|nr:DNA (cytosine-5-)-methyltransferase [Actinomycetota bacterium]